MEVQNNLLKYENELENKKKKLESQVEALKRLADEKYNTLSNGKCNWLVEKDNEINDVNNKLENNLKEKFDYNAKIQILQQEIQNNINIISKEKEQYNKIKETNLMYEDSIASADKTLTEVKLTLEKHDKEVISLKKDICDNSLNYQSLRSKVEFLLKKISNINRNNLSMTEFIENSLKNIEEKKDIVVKRDEQLDNAMFYKNKVIQTLKELNTIKKYLEIQKG